MVDLDPMIMLLSKYAVFRTDFTEMYHLNLPTSLSTPKAQKQCPGMKYNHEAMVDLDPSFFFFLTYLDPSIVLLSNAVKTHTHTHTEVQ
jgi:hypothetical protein